MKFTFEEWCKIKHALTVARTEYEKQMSDSKPSDDTLSFYQIFKRQMLEIDVILEKIEASEI